MTIQSTGDCYELAYKFIVAHGEDLAGRYKLVHGNVAKLSQDHPANHAWVEEGDIVLEVSKGRNFRIPKNVYYERHGITTIRQYNYEEALILAVRSGHYGPWD